MEWIRCSVHYGNASSFHDGSGILLLVVLKLYFIVVLLLHHNIMTSYYPPIMTLSNHFTIPHSLIKKQSNSSHSLLKPYFFSNSSISPILN